MITSGSWRRAARSASGNDAVSVPISRWVMMLWSCVKTNSIGSSIVMILAFRLLLTSLQRARKVQLVEGADLEGDDAQHDVEAAALSGDVDAKAPLSGELEGQVEFVEVRAAMVGVALQKQLGDRLGVLRGENLVAKLHQVAVESVQGEVSHLKVDIRCSLLDPEPKQAVQLLAFHCPTSSARNEPPRCGDLEVPIGDFGGALNRLIAARTGNSSGTGAPCRLH
jgi:hypothetical protein